MAKVNGTLKWAGLFTGLVVLVLTWVWYASAMNSSLKANLEADKRDHPQIQQNHDDIVELKADVKHIKEGVDELRER